MQRPSLCCAPDGSDLALLLQAAPEAVRLASEWLSRDDIGLGRLRIGRDTRGQLMFELQSQASWEHLPVALAGDGLRALLPILLCLCWAESEASDAPSLLAIEEPEAQLHPRLQVGLFDRIIASVSCGLPVAVETHSVYALLSMQRAVLKLKIKPQDVALYWVEQMEDGASRVRQIEIGDDARLSGWPPGVFEEEQALAREIFDARWNQEANERDRAG